MKHQLPEKLLPGWESTTVIETTVNQLIDYLKEREEQGEYAEFDKPYIFPEPNKSKKTITIPKPEWWEETQITNGERVSYRLALEACSKASGITFNLE